MKMSEIERLRSFVKSESLYFSLKNNIDKLIKEREELIECIKTIGFPEGMTDKDKNYIIVIME